MTELCSERPGRHSARGEEVLKAQVAAEGFTLESLEAHSQVLGRATDAGYALPMAGHTEQHHYLHRLGLGGMSRVSHFDQRGHHHNRVACEKAIRGNSAQSL